VSPGMHACTRSSTLTHARNFNMGKKRAHAPNWRVECAHRPQTLVLESTVLVSKTGGCRFESRRPCWLNQVRPADHDSDKRKSPVPGLFQ
jgi:hypothetical protein